MLCGQSASFSLWLKQKVTAASWLEKSIEEDGEEIEEATASLQAAKEFSEDAA